MEDGYLTVATRREGASVINIRCRTDCVSSSLFTRNILSKCSRNTSTLIFSKDWQGIVGENAAINDQTRHFVGTSTRQKAR
ncbi:hypothetical protein BIV08_12335 [Pseudomonas sp. AF76]|nr:hypothetical protein BIV08_12335 [Pseudomonas sp. AF76]